MDAILKQSIWQQFGAALDTLEDALNLARDEHWTVQLWEDEDDMRYGQFWYIAYHTLSWTDLFLTGRREGFAPPPPFIRGALPDEPYSKQAVMTYLNDCRQRAKTAIESLTDEKAYQVCTFEWMEPTYLELQLYSMRHIQEHAAQLNLVLGQQGITGQDWVPKAREIVS